MNEAPASNDEPRDAHDDGAAPGGLPPVDPKRVLDTAVEVIRAPAAFYRGMPQSGGYPEPLLFLVTMSLVATVLSLLLGFVGLGVGGFIAGGLIAVILVPIVASIVAFVAAAIFFGIWMLMGSGKDYETAFRCVAYTAAVAPITTVLDMIPYIGTLVAVLWPMGLLAIASIEVHGRKPQAAWFVFGLLGLVLALSNLSAERKTRDLADELQGFRDALEQRD